MSLIDETLKRAQDTHQSTVQSGTARPWTPAMLPERRTGRRRMAGLLTGILGLGFLAAVVSLLAGRKPSESVRPSATRSSGRAAVAPAAPANASERTTGPRTRTQTDSTPVGQATERLAATHTESPADVKETSQGNPASQPTVRARPASSASRTTLGERPREQLVNGKTYVGEVVLPDGQRIELGGIVYSEERPVALLNGKAVGPGAVAAGFTVVEIEPDRVRLDGNGLTILLSLK